MTCSSIEGIPVARVSEQPDEPTLVLDLPGPLNGESELATKGRNPREPLVHELL